jgi:hypothetical protein
MDNEQQQIPMLEPAEQRVLGSLMEKCRTTPDYYPMTLNSLTAACNQKTSRKPVVNYDEETVASALNSLKKKGLISTATGGSSRVVKFKHNFAIVFPVLPSEVALICLLLLRGPQTAGELNTNSGRLYEFESIEEVQEALEKLAGGDMPYVIQLPRKPGQKEARFTHLLGGAPIIDDDIDEGFHERSGDLEQRVAKLEAELAEMKASLDSLLKELLG